MISDLMISRQTLVRMLIFMECIYGPPKFAVRYDPHTACMCNLWYARNLSWVELAHSPLDFDKGLPKHAVFLSHVKDFSHSQHANVSDPKIIANNYCSLSQSHSVMLTNKFTIIKFTFKNEKKQFSLFFVSTIWWLDDLRSMEKITWENAFQ